MNTTFNPAAASLAVRLLLSTALVAIGCQILLPTTAQAQIYVSNWQTGVIGEYSNSGAPIKPSFLTGLGQLGPTAIVVLPGGNLLVANETKNTISEYSSTGAAIDNSLISVFSPKAIAVSGTDMFVTSANGTVNEYSTSGTLENGPLISGLNSPLGIAVSDTNLFVAVAGSGTVGEYTTAGTVIDSSLITGLTGVVDVAVSGNTLFVLSEGNQGGTGTIGAYTTAGTPLSVPLVTGLDFPQRLAVFGGDLFVTELGIGRVAEFTTSGTTVNPTLVTGLGNGTTAIAVIPEPSGFVLLAVGIGTLYAWASRRRWNAVLSHTRRRPSARAWPDGRR